MATFDNLSNEVVLEILHQLDRRDLPNICLCNRRLFTFTQPLLYSTFKQTGRDEVPLFLRTIFAQPRLTEYVKNIEFTLSMTLPYRSSVHSHEQGPRIDVSFISIEHRAWIEPELQSIGEGTGEPLSGWFEALFDEKNWDALAVLLLHLCSSSLETLTFVYGALPGQYFESIIALTAREWQYKGARYLPRLRSLKLLAPEHPPRRAKLSFQTLYRDILFKLFQLKHLQEIHLEGFTASRYDDRHVLSRCMRYPGDDTECSRKNSEVRKLIITHSTLTGCFMKVFLEYFNGLEIFKYQRTFFRDGARTIRGKLLPRKVKEGLKYSKHCLKELVMQDQTCKPGEFDFGEDDGGTERQDNLLGSMSDFTALRTLEVTASMIMGPSLQPGLDEEYTEEGYPPDTPAQCSDFAHGLPNSLVHLTLAECQPPIFDALSELLFNKTILNKLKSIHVISDASNIPLHPANGRTWNEYMSAAQEKGVELRFSEKHS